MVFAKATSPEELFKKSFISLYEYKRKPTIPDLLKEDNAVLILEGSLVKPRIFFDSPFPSAPLNYDKLIDGGNGKFEVEYQHYYEELIKPKKIEPLIEHLKTNSFSKRGIVGLWQEDYRDLHQPVPCLIYLSFLIRDQKLDMNAHLRANDAYRIFLVDFHILRNIQNYTAENLGLKIGNYIHIVDSFHIYRKDADFARNLYQKLINL